MNLRNVGLGLLLSAAVVVTGGTAWRALRPEATSRALSDEAQQPLDQREVVWICTETRRLQRGPWHDGRDLNPATGRWTMVPAMHCALCRTWYPAPAAMMQPAQRLGPRCPRDGALLEADGPVP